MTLLIVVLPALAFLLFLTGSGAAHSTSTVQLTRNQAVGKIVVSLEHGGK
ncbi:MAG: hypothetical protein LUO81_00110 [Methanoregulaceae archaeon]|nr:hypothetical protein [Methanoregulaceae archaeon]